MEKTCYALRLFARIIDLMLVGLILVVLDSVIDGASVSLLLAYPLYGIVVGLCGGKSLGKYLLSLEIQVNRSGVVGILVRMIREPLLLILLPLVFLNFLCISPLPLHDRISGTKVVRDEI